MVQVETREAVVQEMEERMKLMERMHAQRLQREVSQVVCTYHLHRRQISPYHIAV